MRRVCHVPDAVAAAAAEEIVAAAARAIAARGEFRLGVSGGTTPERLYRRLVGEVRAGRVDRERIVVLFADERAVPPDHPDSNYAMVARTLLVPADLGPERVRRMVGEARDLNAAARAYESELVAPIDVLVLGIGTDGHTASLFPGRTAVTERVRRAVAVRDSPKPPPRRLTITPRTIGEARTVLVLATGADKADAVARAWADDATPEQIPAALLAARDWLVDRAAAGGTESTG